MTAILHVLSSLDQRDGGPVRAVLDLSTEGFQRGIHAEVIGVGKIAIPDNPFPPEYLHTVSESFPKIYRYSKDLRHWLRRNISRFQGVVIHGMWQYPQWAAAQECIRQGVRYACFPHGMLDRWPVYGQGRWKAVKKVLYWRWRERRIFDHASGVLFTANREMESAAEVFDLRSQRLLLIPYGVRPAVDNVSKPRNAELIQPENRKVALFLSRIHPKKNIDFLLRAWMKADLPANWHLVIAGDGEASYVENLKTLSHDFQLDDQVHFVGHVAGDDKFYLLNRADWFLLPSSQENFGIAVLEAVQARCAVAISDQVYLADYLRSDSEILHLSESDWVNFLRDRMVDDSWRREVEQRDYEHITRAMAGMVEGWCRVLSDVFASEHGTGEARAEA